MKEKTLRPIGATLSVAIHAGLLFIGSAALVQKAQYGEANQSTEVELVAAPPDEVKAPKEIYQPIKPDDVVRYKRKKSASPTPPPETTQPPPTATSTAPSSHSSSGPMGPVSAQPDYLRNPPPPYPEESKMNHEEGLVILLVDVSQDGTPVEVHVKKSSGYRRLDEAAVVTVQSWKFKPGTLDGAPVKSEVEVPVRFRLQQD